jgi:hypothetical protein
MTANKDLLAKKIELESKWNRCYLEAGKVTVEMKPIEEEIRFVRRQMVSADNIRLAQNEIPREDLIPNYAS